MKAIPATFLVSLSVHAVVGASLSPVLLSPIEKPEAIEVRYKKYSADKPAFSPKKETKVVPPVAKKSQPAIAHVLKAQTAAPEALPPVKKSAEFLADPIKGKFFLNYFGQIKDEIRKTLRRKWSPGGESQGEASLLFILRSDGRLEKLEILDKKSTCPPEFRKLAAECVAEASPFASFPRELEAQRISFNLVISFEGE